MKNKITLLFALTALVLFGFKDHAGGLYKTSTGNISFYSHTPIEDIRAENHTVSSAFKDGVIQFKVLVKNFKFKKALMQQHFNEKYMESTTYPNAKFSGKIANFDSIKLNTNGVYNTTVTGKLTIKDVTKTVTVPAKFTVNNGVVNGHAVFNVKPTDYNIKIQKSVVGKIADSIKITVDADYKHQH